MDWKKVQYDLTFHVPPPRKLLGFGRLIWVLAFDHVSTLTPQIAGALCRPTSSVGVALREPGQGA